MTRRPLARLRAQGRGRRYGIVRGLLELTARWVYRGAWPARAWALVPGRTRVTRLDHELAILPPGAPPLRIGYASDLHIGPTTPPALLANAAKLLREARLDVLLLGGDYVYLDATEAVGATLAEWVGSIPARRKFAVLGNHDLWTHHHVLEAALAAGGAEVLLNSAARIAHPGGDVAVLGIDDPWTGTPDVDAALAAAGDAPVRLTLVHSPKAAAWVAGRVHAVVCGHTHGGHIAYPTGSPVIAPGRSARRWPHGRHDVDGTTLIVSRGIGGVEVPVRTWAPPDVLVIELVARAS